MTKVNCVCKLCKKRLNSTLECLMSCMKCEHMVHSSCFNNGNCTLCINCGYNEVVPEDSHMMTRQMIANVKSCKRTQFKPKLVDYIRLLTRLPLLTYYFSVLMFNWFIGNHTDEIYNYFVDGFMYCLNINVNLIGFDKIDKNKKMVYVCNHTGHHDSFLINRFIKGKVLASDAILHTFIGRLMAEFTKPFIIKRGQSSNTSTMVSNHIEKEGSIVVFPQAILTNNKTITKFRTGAFVLNLPIQPILFEYVEDQSSMTILPDMFCFPKVNVTIRALDLVVNENKLPPDQFAEHVRLIMALTGGFLLSNVDSHDVKD